MYSNLISERTDAFLGAYVDLAADVYGCDVCFQAIIEKACLSFLSEQLATILNCVAENKHVKILSDGTVAEFSSTPKADEMSRIDDLYNDISKALG